MRTSALVSSVAIAVASVSHADIFQYEDCDGDGSLLLTELDAVPGADLSGLYLGCADLGGADLSGADLSGADLSNANLIFANLSGADLSGAKLSFAFMLEAHLSGVNLSDADLSGADLTLVQSGGIVGTPFGLPPEWSLRSGYLIGPGVNLSDADLSGSDLSGAILTNAYMLFANLSGADLSGADLTLAFLRGANLSDADLTNADLSNADLFLADLSGADFTGATGYAYIDISIFTSSQTGSCCLPTGCTTISDRQCTEIGGVWTEDGSCEDCSSAFCSGDITGDAIVGFDDLVIVISNWGVCP